MISTNSLWLTSIHVKNSFVNEPTDEDIKYSASLIVRGMERIQKTFEKVIDDNFMDFDIVLDNFKSIIYHIDNGDKAEDIDSLGSWRSWKDAFNEYMAMLYDLADERVNVTGQRGFEDGRYKFIWVA